MAGTTTNQGFTNLDKLNLAQDNDGSASEPSLTFAGDTDTGIYRSSANTVEIATGGTKRVTVDSSGLTVDSGSLITSALALASAGVVLKQAKVTVTAAEIKALAATQIELVAAPGASKYNIFLGALLELDFGTTAFDDAAADGDLVIRYTNGSGQVCAVVEADAFIDSSADDVRWAWPNDALDGDNPAITPVANAAIVLDNDGAEFTGASGDSVLDVTVFYAEVDSQL